ncbi:MAG: efflux RND transporter permease subunit [Gammaproteobacteria bacterium]|nr:efflux RND transporter permease subunit [Gammaproteobacteria bacterium]
MEFSVFAFIGLIMLMGLVTKNAILLVDYTLVLEARGHATLSAARRPPGSAFGRC